MSKLYLKRRPAPRLYLALPERQDLYLDIDKANPFRDPSVGQYIAGGAVKANTEDLSDEIESLLDQMPGDSDNE